MAYCTREQVRTYKGFKTSDTANDSLIDDLITRAKVIIDNYCGRTFESSANTTRNFDAIADVSDDGLILYFDEDLSSINTITNGDGVSVSSSEYVTEPRNDTPYYAIRLLASSGKAWEYTTDHENAIAVNGSWSYSASVPSDIEQACIELVAYMFDKRTRLVDDSRSQVSPDGVVLMPSDIPRSVQRILKPYRKII